MHQLDVKEPTAVINHSLTNGDPPIHIISTLGEWMRRRISQTYGKTMIQNPIKIAQALGEPGVSDNSTDDL
jgi:hypothetical protein